MRQMDSRVYSPAQCVGQLAENSAAKGSNFNATSFEVTILPQFASSTRAKGTDRGVPSNTQALKVLDDGVGFLYGEIQDMLTYGTPESITADKKFGANNHGLKAVAATLSPACCLLFSKSKAPDGSIWHTLLAFGANFDYDGLYNFRGLSWPASFTGTSLQSLADADFYHCGSLDAYKDLFRTGGKTWATVRDLTAAHAHFREIKGTGVLGIFPFGQESTTLKAEVLEDNIKLQGIGLKELLEKYFVAPELGLLEQEYWANYKGFKMILNVNRRKRITIQPLPPRFPVSPPITVSIGQAQHTVVYGPYFSSQHEHSLFPYVHNAGQTFHTQTNGFYLASNSRIMNPLHRPKITGDGGTRNEYFSRQKVSQKPASAVMQKLLATMCGDNLGDGAPELYTELEDLLKANRVFDNKNPYLQKSDEYQKQMKNLKWLLGLPFEITARIDKEYLQFNDAKDDLKDDALKRDSFFASVHTAVALDVLQRMLPGFKRLMLDADAAKPDKQLKMDTLFKSDKAPAGQAKAGPSKCKSAAPTKRVPKTPQQAQREQQAEHAEHAQQAKTATAVGRTSKRSMAAAAAAAEAVDAPAAAAAAAGNTSSGNSVMDEEEEGRSARAARVQSRAEDLHPTQLGSPSAPRGSKHRRGDVASDGNQHEALDVLAAVAEDYLPSQSQIVANDSQTSSVRERPTSTTATTSRGLLESDLEPASKRIRTYDVQHFDQLWRKAVEEKMIVECELTRNLKAMASAKIGTSCASA
ncbi:hypothetical protein WJX77_004246 [Trebouxia sp. C0004]